MIAATLGVLTSDGKPVCVDAVTRGQPLVIYRTMRDAPRPSRLPLTWRAPAALRPPRELDARDIYRDETNRRRILLEQPGNEAGGLSPMDQLRLDLEATALSQVHDTDTVTIRDSWGVPGVTARWGPRNWFARDCVPRYELSNPVRRGGVAFVSVKAAHWGTTYALERVAGAWRVSAQWSSWLY